MKTFYVTFDKDGGWVSKGMPPSEPHLVNPDLSRVRGVPPELWQLVNGHIVPKDSGDLTSGRPAPSKKLLNKKIISLALALALSVLLLLILRKLK